MTRASSGAAPAVLLCSSAIGAFAAGAIGAGALAGDVLIAAGSAAGLFGLWLRRRGIAPNAAPYCLAATVFLAFEAGASGKRPEVVRVSLAIGAALSLGLVILAASNAGGDA